MRYYEVIQEEKLIDLRSQAIVVSNACARAFGSIDEKQWTELIDAMTTRKKEIQKDAIVEMKAVGIEIEEN